MEDMRQEIEALRAENGKTNRVLYQARKKIETASDILKTHDNIDQIKTCMGKKVYSTREGAEYAALALYYMDGRMLTEYNCRHCMRWHLTGSNKPGRLVGEELVRSKASRRLTSTIQEILESKGQIL